MKKKFASRSAFFNPPVLIRFALGVIGVLLTLLSFVLYPGATVLAGRQSSEKNADSQTGTLEKLIVVRGSVTMALERSRLTGSFPETDESGRETVRFEIEPNSFFAIRLFNDVLRGPLPGQMRLMPENPAILPEPLKTWSSQLVLEAVRSGGPFDLVVRDGQSGLLFFNIEGNSYEYDPTARLFSVTGGRLLISEELANKLGRPADAGSIAGEISFTATMSPIEITTIVNGTARSSILPPRRGGVTSAPDVFVPGPDIMVGDMNGLAQFGSSGTQVGLGIGTTACNNGDQEVHFFQLPNPDHSVISQNLYRMSGGASNNDRFEQIGQAWVKHTFGADQFDECGFGCTPAANQTTLGVGCSDAYGAAQNAHQTDQVGALGSRAWVNPFTGAFPGSSPRPENHTGHVHTGTSHRILVEAHDLNTTMNSGATYYAEVQYDSPHEYAWCQTHPGQCNMYNNASYRQFSVTGTTSFSFASIGSTVRMVPATNAWTGATGSKVEPEPGVDGVAFVVYKVTNPSAGVWHYEYAIHNQNLDRSIQSFTVPIGCGVTLSNIGFHAPPNHPGFQNDGTVGNTGFSNAAWTTTQTAGNLSWNAETFAQNQNANAIRFGTMYNFRFDADHPPQPAGATVGFFKTGTSMIVGIQGPAPDTVCGPTPTPGPTTTPIPTPTPTPIPTASPTPTPTPPFTASVTGTISYCSNPSPGPVPGVTLTLTGTSLGSVLSDGSGNYTLAGLAIDGSFAVTPSKADRVPGSAGINTIDVLAVQKHFLGTVPLTGCRLTAANVTGGPINTLDVLAIQHFFLGQTSGVANVGKYQFTPVSRTYAPLGIDQTGQNFDALIFGDVAGPFADRAGGSQ